MKDLTDVLQMLPAVTHNLQLDLERIVPGLPFSFNLDFLLFCHVQLQVDEISD